MFPTPHGGPAFPAPPQGCRLLNISTARGRGADHKSKLWTFICNQRNNVNWPVLRCNYREKYPVQEFLLGLLNGGQGNFSGNSHPGPLGSKTSPAQRGSSYSGGCAGSRCSRGVQQRRVSRGRGLGFAYGKQKLSETSGILSKKGDVFSLTFPYLVTEWDTETVRW